MWSVFTPGCGLILFIPLTNTLNDQHANNHNQLKPHGFILHQWPALQQQTWVRGRQIYCVSKRGRQWQRKRLEAKQRRSRENKGRERGRQGKREKCGGSMSAADKSISLPPVGQRKRLTLPVSLSACGSLGLVNQQLIRPEQSQSQDSLWTVQTDTTLLLSKCV